ncbi:MAG: SulP family inorganic anion transporter, partial [Rhodospirillales bacterium]|nr:SulP family inorganic anion transporter [Rhodospirillales bacterium]
QQIDGNQEFIGQGLSNLAGCFFSGYVATGSFNRSALNHDAGARTPMATVSAGVMLIILVPLVAPWAGLLPKSVVAGILFLVVTGLIDFTHIRHIIHSSKSETTVMTVTFFSVLFINLEVAIFAGVILSLVFYLNRTSHPKVTTLAPNNAAERRRFSVDPALPECPQVKIVRIDGSLFYGAISNVMAQLRRLERHDPAQKKLLVVGSGINFIDMEGAEALAGEARRRRASVGDLFLVGIKDQVAYQLERTDQIDLIGRDNIFTSKTAALGYLYQGLDRNLCESCTARIFRECLDGAKPPAPATELPALVTAPPLPAQPVPKPPTEKPGRPPRILGLIDLDVGGLKTATEAWNLAKDKDGELALGQVINWKLGSGSSLQASFVAAGAEAALCVPGRLQLGELAAEIGIEDPTLLATATHDMDHAILELIEDWGPDV